MGKLPYGPLSHLCDEGRTLREIAALAEVSRQAVHQRITGTELGRARDRRIDANRRARSFARFCRTRVGQRLATAGAEIRKHCPDLSIQWRWFRRANVHSWQLLVDVWPLTIYRALAATQIGAPGHYYRVYRAALARPSRAYLVITGDHRRALYLGPPAGSYVWFEVEPPYRRSQTVAPDYEWRG